MEASCTVQTKRNSCKFFSENDTKKKKKMARAISKNQVSDLGPSWPSCQFLFAKFDPSIDMALVNGGYLQ